LSPSYCGHEERHWNVPHSAGVTSPTLGQVLAYTQSLHVYTARSSSPVGSYAISLSTATTGSGLVATASNGDSPAPASSGSAVGSSAGTTSGSSAPSSSAASVWMAASP